MATDTTAEDVSVDLRSPDGESAGKTSLAGEVFGIEPNTAVMHQVVTAQRAAGRAGSNSTLTRAEVRGGGAKPWRQKGTGRARQGSIRAPHWAGGGIAHGPKPRDYSQRTPKKMVKLALRSALSDRAAEGKVVVVDGWSFDAPKTKAAKSALDALGVASSDRALVVLSRNDEMAWKSFRNLEGERRVHVIDDTQLNAYEVLVADWVLFTADTLATVTERLTPATRSDAGDAAADLEPAPTAIDESTETADDTDSETGGDE